MVSGGWVAITGQFMSLTMDCSDGFSGFPKAQAAPGVVLAPAVKGIAQLYVRTSSKSP